MSALREPRYPQLEVNLAGIRQNARAVTGYCTQRGITACGVIKFADGDLRVARAYYQGGCRQLASSRLPHLSAIRRALPKAQTVLLRLPMLAEVDEVVRWCDWSVHSQRETLERLQNAAAVQGKTHGVVLLLDVGDLREGVPTPAALYKLAMAVEREMPHLHLLGVGSTFTCFGSILPDRENLGVLLAAAKEIERGIGRRLEIISGGSSSSLALLQSAGMPSGVNHLRIGGAIANPRAARLTRGIAIPGMCEGTFTLRAEVIEVEQKPSKPYGQTSVNWTGKAVKFADRGLRRRAILALGSQDIGDAGRLMARDEGVSVLGCSSDHTILDVQDSGRVWQVGDIAAFDLFYAPLLQIFSTRHVQIDYRE